MKTIKHRFSITLSRTLAVRLAAGLAALCAALAVSAADAQVRSKGLTGGFEALQRAIEDGWARARSG